MNLIKTTYIFILIMMLSSVSLSQEFDEGKVKVIQDPLIDSLGNQYALYQNELHQNEDNDGITGYRVQIFFDSGNYSGKRAEEAKELFVEEYNDIPAYITWRSPNYRVRVGDFRSRLDAEKFLRKILRDYPNAWVIKCEINYPKLYKSENYEENTGSY